MIITHRTARLSYSTDATADNLRTFVAAPRINIASRAHASTQSLPSDSIRLYPSLYVKTAKRSNQLGIAVRALAIRLSVFGSAAALMAVMLGR